MELPIKMNDVPPRPKVSWVRDEDHDPSWLSNRMVPAEQAAWLRRLADAVEETGIAVTGSLSPAFNYIDAQALSLEHARLVARRMARTTIMLIRRAQVREQVKKVNNEYQWGVRAQLCPGLHIEWTMGQNLTCEEVPVLDDDGKPVIERVKKYVSAEVEVEQVVTERVCTKLF